jgi:ankyrin repeat protein
MNLNEQLIEAATKGNTQEVKSLLEQGADIHAEDFYGYKDAAIRLAASHGHTETAKLLLENGADIHADNDYALRGAAVYGHTETAKLLLENGADIHAEDDLALCLATLYDYTEIAKLLLKHYKTISDLETLLKNEGFPKDPIQKEIETRTKKFQAIHRMVDAHPLIEI